MPNVAWSTQRNIANPPTSYSKPKEKSTLKELITSFVVETKGRFNKNEAKIVDKSAIVSVGKNFVILEGGVFVENHSVIDSKSIDIGMNSFENGKSLKKEVVNDVKKTTFVDELVGNIISKELVIEKEEPNSKVGDDNSWKLNFKVVLGSISFSSKRFVIPPFPYRKHCLRRSWMTNFFKFLDVFKKIQVNIPLVEA